MSRVLLLALLLFSAPALAGQVPNPANISGTVTSGHMIVGTGGQNFVDGGVPGAGNVAGPGSSVNNNFATFNGTTGAIIKDSGSSWASPGAIGGTTPNTGAFTSLTTGNTALTSGALTQSSGNLGLFVPSNGLLVFHDSTNGVGFTLGGSAGTITGRLNILPGIANAPIAFTTSSSTNTNQGFAFSTSGRGQTSFLIPNSSGTYSNPGSNAYNCGGGGGSYVLVCNNADTADAASAAIPPTGLGIFTKAGGAGTTGGRWAFTSNFTLTADTSDSTNVFYNSGVFHTAIRGNSGGNSTTSLGAAFGEVAYCDLQAGATFYTECAGVEFDLSAETGSSVQKIHGSSVVLLGSNAVTPTIESTGYAVAATAGSQPTIQTALSIGRMDGVNALSSGAAVIQFHPLQFNGMGPSIAYGDDYRLGTFSGSALALNGGAIFGNGNIRIGRTYLTDSSSGLTIDSGGSIGVSATVAAAGTGYAAPYANATDAYGGIWQETFSGGAVTAVTMLRAPAVSGATPANPISLTSSPGQIGSGATINITWATGGTVTINGATQVATLKATALPTSCSGQPTNTIAAVAAVLTLCP